MSAAFEGLGITYEPVRIYANRNIPTDIQVHKVSSL
jgi:hypothetical protein